MPFYVYILKCQNDYLYTGITRNLVKRVREHEDGTGSPVTKNRRPLKLVYVKGFETREEVARREKEIKGWRREKKEDLIVKESLP